MKVSLNKLPILEIARVMQEIQDTPPLLQTWYKGKIISPTLPSKKLKYG